MAKEIERLAKWINQYLKEVGVSTSEVEKEMTNAVRWAYGKLVEEEKNENWR